MYCIFLWFCHRQACSCSLKKMSLCPYCTCGLLHVSYIGEVEIWQYNLMFLNLRVGVCTMLILQMNLKNGDSLFYVHMHYHPRRFAKWIATLKFSLCARIDPMSFSNVNNTSRPWWWNLNWGIKKNVAAPTFEWHGPQLIRYPTIWVSV